EGLNRVAVADADAAGAGKLTQQLQHRASHALRHLLHRLVVLEEPRPHHVHEPLRSPPGDVSRAHPLQIAAEARLGQVVGGYDGYPGQTRCDDIGALSRALQRTRVDATGRASREVGSDGFRLAHAFGAETKAGQVAVENARRIVDVAVANQVDAGAERLGHRGRCYG